VMATQARAVGLVLDQKFDQAIWDDGANFNPIAPLGGPSGPVNDTANGGGIWTGTAGSSSTASVWGDPVNSGTNGALNLQAGGVVSGDIGTDISTGVVSVKMDLRRELRGGIFGGRATEQLVQHTLPAGESGDTSGMLFGVIWEHDAIYAIDPNGYYGEVILPIGSVTGSNNVWVPDALEFILNFAAGTYSVSIGEIGFVKGGLALNTAAGNDFLRYVHLETIFPTQFGSVYIDNIVVDDDATLLTRDGDFDGDLDVDGFDFLKWQRGESTTAPLSLGDLADWELNFGTPFALQAVSTAAAVPEPASLLLVAIAALSLAASRGRVSYRKNRLLA